jgi:primosomal protein N' (replication factor Y)
MKEKIAEKNEKTANRSVGFASILFPLPFHHPYTYKVPESFLESSFSLQEGCCVQAPWRRDRLWGIVWKISQTPPHDVPLEKIRFLESIGDGPPFTKAFQDFLKWVSWYTVTPLGSVLRLAMPSASQRIQRSCIGVSLAQERPYIARMTPMRSRVLSYMATLKAPILKADLAKATRVCLSVINGLIDAGVLVLSPLHYDDEGCDIQAYYGVLTLTPVQTQSLQKLRSYLNENPYRPVALEGVTGSGKTVVYFEIIADMIHAGRQVLVLVPEIALTSSFLKIFEQRFGVRPAIWHSTVSEARRGRIYRSVAQGKTGILIGTRSALFLPFANLGLIVVDEEHDGAYKQEDGVLYHARDMAYIRARMEKASLLLVSATLSLETRYNIVQKRIAHVALPVRFEDRPLPQIGVVDVRKDPYIPERWISSSLQEAISETLNARQQTLLFLNRRGYAPMTLCRTCGYRFVCPHCDSRLVEHRKRKVLLCHHCGYNVPRASVCLSCGAQENLVACGLGIERLTEEVRSLFPEARILTLSADLVGTEQKLSEAFSRIEAGDVDVIIGTQLITKGHTFPLLTLVGVIDADSGLDRSTDPRGTERLFQLLTQVAGRAGRAKISGRALLQTWQPENPIIKTLVATDSEAFYRYEWQMREQGELPPFGRLTAIIVSSSDFRRAESYAQSIVRIGLQHKPESVRILGPVEAPLARCQGRYRFRILIRCHRQVLLQKFLHIWVSSFPKAHGDLRCVLDVDPYSFF